MGGSQSGVLLNRTGTSARDRVIALGPGNEFLGETHPEADGRWSMTVGGAASRIVAQEAGERIGAAIAQVADSGQITLPAVIPVEFTFDPVVQGAELAVDPLALTGFPGDLLWVLRTHPSNVIDLHVGQYSVGPSPVRVDLQSGRYRLSGGRLALHPVISQAQAAQRLAGVEDVASGQRLSATNGEIVLDVSGPARYRVTFEPSP